MAKHTWKKSRKQNDVESTCIKSNRTIIVTTHTCLISRLEKLARGTICTSYYYNQKFFLNSPIAFSLNV